MTKTATLLRLLKTGYLTIIGTNLVGIYLHGSYVMHAYNESVSDLDYIVVVRQPLSFSTKSQLLAYTVNQLWPLSPKKGLEFHVLLLKDTHHFVDPLPFDLHFSQMHYQEYLMNNTEYISKMQGVDPDLAAHLTIINHFGQVLIGPPVKTVFSPVPEAVYGQSILFDINDAEREIVNQPMYVILNLCRALAFKNDHLITSKLSGGQWALTHLSNTKYQLINAAISDYTGTGASKALTCYSSRELQDFANHMLKLIRQ